MNITEAMHQLRDLQARSPSLRPAFILALDEAAELNQAAEAGLDAIGIPSLLATDESGQPAVAMPELMRLLRTLCERDLGLGLGYILTTFMAATNVWVAGSSEQKAQCNALLAAGKKISIAYHELEHGNDFAANELTAQPVPGGYLLQGRKQVINNIGRAGAVVLQARTSPEQGMRTHSLFLVDTQLLASEQHHKLPRFATQGVRGCQISGIEFEACFIPDACLLGKEGFAFSYALTAFQITRALLPGISLGTIDSALAITARYASQRTLYGNNLLTIPNVRAELTLAWLDYALCDNLSYVAARGLHTVPAEMSVLGSLCKAQVPLRMRTVLKKLALVLGSRYYLREGEAALFEKIMRDYPVVSLGHASSFTCQASLIPQLPLIFKRFNTPREDLQQSLILLFSPQVKHAFTTGALKLTSSGKDLLLHSIHYWPEHVGALMRSQSISQPDGDLLLQRLGMLHSHCVQLSETTFAADEYQAFETVQRYAWIQSALATVGRWCLDSTSPFAGDVNYLVTCLDFVFSQLRHCPFYPDPKVEGNILAYLQSRSEARGG
ncbi:acyl-CoA dehydrogenase [Rouxiella badensis]|jgi:alkylation response protein AidB-like acyl-CoA dehydrogenase|uniref:Acyl-CoA dehydrogenase/oxidase C-terminal domain-containing protein n=1 Tax=Rouxiella badensis TaxID=1646377 RepID=A0A1X0WH29_9GAMM|nr:acyl-CoA dehydrogenase [Rouxiella badensis]MCC3705004.1 acyl-CoA dehydrogenase [Rouxiella badensis]MCC3721462.1 acyl-CoA dehydrogenase [Rouxiella badensis]MCC3731027.1 acyl-CoA dehydrogenase [Rouxiella badensis]MCC3735244.1 acyl-CoA dehydrogenase [Rouxiella badensis]MCC3742338.1 acyl-CoA dehydrogenase [Rouxiella badensis]